MPELKGRLSANQRLADITWFRVGGPAQVLFSPTDESDLVYFLQRARADLPVTVIGLGSMGLGMANSLRRAGFDVAGCDVTLATRAQPFAAWSDARRLAGPRAALEIHRRDPLPGVRYVPWNGTRPITVSR